MRIRHDLLIDAPPERVFKYLVHPDYLPIWIRSLRDMEYDAKPDIKSMGGVRFSYKAGGRAWKVIILGSHYPTSCRVQSVADAYEYRDSFHLQEVDGKTKLFIQTDVTFKSLIFKLIGSLSANALRESSRLNMRKLKYAVENNRSSTVDSADIEAEIMGADDASPSNSFLVGILGFAGFLGGLVLAEKTWGLDNEEAGVKPLAVMFGCLVGGGILGMVIAKYFLRKKDGEETH